MTNPSLRARVAYSMGRVVWALPRALIVAALVFALAMAIGTNTDPVIIGVSVLALIAVAGWRSKGALVGGVLGVTAACAAACIVNWVSGFKGCGALEVKLACVAVGGSAGALVGYLAAKNRRRLDIVVGAFAGATLHVLMGCVYAGFAEALGLVVGVALGVIPAVALTARRASSAAPKAP